MLDPTVGGLLKMKKEGFEINELVTGPAAGQNPNMFANNGAMDAEMVNANPNANTSANANTNANTNDVAESNNGVFGLGKLFGSNAAEPAEVSEGFQGVNPSPADFVPAEKPKNCYPKNQLAPQELLPNDPNSKWAQVNPMGAGDIAGKNFLNAGSLIGVNTVGQSLRNANHQLRSEPPNPQVPVTVFNVSTIEPDTNRRDLEVN